MYAVNNTLELRDQHLQPQVKMDLPENRNANRECDACPEGTFSVETDAAQCREYSKPPAGQYAIGGTATKDVTFLPCIDYSGEVCSTLRRGHVVPPVHRAAAMHLISFLRSVPSNIFVPIRRTVLQKCIVQPAHVAMRALSYMGAPASSVYSLMPLTPSGCARCVC